MKRILFVHDLQSDAWERHQLLEASGFEVDLTSKSAEAIERIERHCPDLVVLDVLLEGHNGFEVCRQLRSRFSPEDLPILMCAGIYQDACFIREAEEAGVQDYATKIDGGNLVGRIMVLLRSSSARRETGKEAPTRVTAES